MKFKLGYKISLLLIVATLAGVTFLSYSYISTTRKTTEALLKDYHIGISDEITGFIESSIAVELGIINHIIVIFNDPHNSETEKVALAHAIIQSSRDVNFLAIYDERGRLIDVFQQPSKAHGSLFPESLNVRLVNSGKDLSAQVLYSSTDSLPYMQLIVPWQTADSSAPNRAIGYLLTALPLGPFSDVAAGISYRRFSGQPDRIFLVNEQGEVIASADRNLVKRRASLLTTDLFTEKDSASLRTLFQRDVGFSREYSNLGNRRMLASFVASSRLHMGIVVEEPVDEAFASLDSMTRHLLLWSSLSIIAAVIVGIYFSRSITRPMRDLVGAATRIESGSYGSIVPISTTDEVAELSTAFNRMSVKLKQSFDELHEANDQIVRMEKLASRGEVAAEVSHELKNVLQNLLLRCYFLKNPGSEETPESIRRAIDEIDAGLNRIKVFSENLLVRGGTGQNIRPVDIGELLRSFTLFIQSLPRFRKSTIDILISGEGFPVLVDADQMGQVLLNLANNAVEASPDCRLKFSAVFTPGIPTVSITVADDGPGIPPDTLEKLFHERITTKKEGHGFGLPICHQIIESMNGSIQVESEPGKGTTFTIMLPSEGTFEDDEETVIEP